MRELVMVLGIYAAVFFLGWGGVLISSISSAKETTTLDEKLEGVKAHVQVFVDEKHGNVCYYRRHGDGISCLPCTFCTK